ncbi:hypothetical protein SAMN04487761_15216 [Lachnospiraceae bacterium C7]|nr:hypothetical protein SAMN04487761_15216 [Lachnospiraceae bacterium C7]
MQETYIEIMLQSLRKKELVLDRIIEFDDLQRDELLNSKLTPDDFDAIVEQKSKCIDELNMLDEGFQDLFDRVKDEIMNNRQMYAEQIHEMQGCIRRITDKSVQIQSQEIRNKELMTNKFSTIKKQARTIRANKSVVSKYSQNMKMTNYIDPQFMDNKK